MEARVSDLPTGMVTFLFTDMEGSTRLWERYPDDMPAALERHDAILSQNISDHAGVVFRTVGDAFCAAFGAPLPAICAALGAQRALHNEPWGAIGAMRVRMGLHTSEVELREDGYFGPPLNRVARLMAAGHGGQTLICRVTQELVRDQLPDGIELHDLGEHYLRDLSQPEHIFLLIGNDMPCDFPPLKTLTNQTEAHISRQHKLPGMPEVDFDAIFKKAKSGKPKKRRSKSKGTPEGGLF
jgi:class 3 adenylate cyclase